MKPGLTYSLIMIGYLVFSLNSSWATDVFWGSEGFNIVLDNFTDDEIIQLLKDNGYDYEIKDNLFVKKADDTLVTRTIKFQKNKYKRTVMNFVDGKKHGYWMWRKDGPFCEQNLFQGSYKHNIRDGFWKVTEDIQNDCVFQYIYSHEVPYKDGVLHGTWRTLEEDRLFAEGKFVDGKKVGHWGYFMSNSNYQRSKTYVSGDPSE